MVPAMSTMPTMRIISNTMGNPAAIWMSPGTIPMSGSMPIPSIVKPPEASIEDWHRNNFGWSVYHRCWYHRYRYRHQYRRTAAKSKTLTRHPYQQHCRNYENTFKLHISTLFYILQAIRKNFNFRPSLIIIQHGCSKHQRT